MSSTDIPPDKESLQFIKQDKGLLLFNQYHYSANVIYSLCELSPFIKRVAFNRYGKKSYIRRFQNQSAGLIDRTCCLKRQIIFACSQRKIPCVPPPVLHPMHNYGRTSFNPWSHYYDMKNITLLFLDENENIVAKRKVKVISEGDFVKAYFYKYFWKRIQIATIAKHNQPLNATRCLRYILDKQYSHVNIEFEPSQQVRTLANKIIAQLGSYYALHIRRTDTLQHEKYTFISVESILKEIKAKIPVGSRLYVLTDEKDRDFLECFNKDYEMYQYTDFPELNNLIAEENFDNYLLFTIERVIFTYAKLSIAPLIIDGVYHDRAVHYISFNKSPPLFKNDDSLG